jgi:hypothetical protein
VIRHPGPTQQPVAGVKLVDRLGTSVGRRGDRQLPADDVDDGVVATRLPPVGRTMRADVLGDADRTAFPAQLPHRTRALKVSPTYLHDAVLTRLVQQVGVPAVERLGDERQRLQRRCGTVVLDLREKWDRQAAALAQLGERQTAHPAQTPYHAADAHRRAV